MTNSNDPCKLSRAIQSAKTSDTLVLEDLIRCVQDHDRPPRLDVHQTYKRVQLFTLRMPKISIDSASTRLSLAKNLLQLKNNFQFKSHQWPRDHQSTRLIRREHTAPGKTSKLSSENPFSRSLPQRPGLALHYPSPPARSARLLTDPSGKSSSSLLEGRLIGRITSGLFGGLGSMSEEGFGHRCLEVRWKCKVEEAMMSCSVCVLGILRTCWIFCKRIRKRM